VIPSTTSEPGTQPRLTIVSAGLAGGGAERQLAEMANYWAARGIAVSLITWSEPGSDFYKLHADVHRINLQRAMRWRALSRTFGNLRHIVRLRRAVISTAPSTVLSFIAENNILTILACWGLEARIVVSERSQPEYDVSVAFVWRVLRRLLYVRCDAVIAQTTEAASWIERNCRVKSLVIPNALRELCAPHRQRETLIIAVGRLSREKGFDLLLHGFAMNAARYPDWRVVILGEGGERSALTKLRDGLGLSDRVQFAGQATEVEEWMARASIVVQPSRFEGFPNVVLEAMGMGAAVISANCHSGPSELIEDGVNGRLVPVDDAVALAHVLEELMGDAATRGRLGREAMGVRERFRQGRVMALWSNSLLPRYRPHRQVVAAMHEGD
jgi:GalNAc-alpha-(1->4)-GalNAc-alpha-(1->3)-diNAcBac-PP-undecaprenol alpha-1,4-N-acetyl-D-galactosaminyltransferase